MASHCCQRKKARMWGGRCRKEGARAAGTEKDLEPLRGRPGRDGPLISATPQGVSRSASPA